VLQWQDSNTLVQRSLDAVDGDVWGAARALPWASAPLPGAPSATGLLLRLTLDGEPGACAEPLAPPSPTGLLRGAWAQVGGVPDCGGSGASQLTFACADCDLGPGAALSFTFHYSCQSLLLEAAAVPAYPAGATSLLVASAAATAAAPNGGALLTSLTWEAPPLFTQCRDNVTAGAAASKRGYAFTQSTVSPVRPPLPADGGGMLLVRPAAAALNLTIVLPLAPTFITTSLTPLVPWTQLFANIVGLSGVVGVVGLLFSVAERGLVRGGSGGKGGPLGSGGAGEEGASGDVRAQLARLSALVKEAAALERNLVRALGSDHHEPIVVENPLADARGRSADGGAPAEGGRAPDAGAWYRHAENTDVWYTNSKGESAWELPEGAVLAKP
jgi:hypothetical protein